jgi:hypothetical protein
MPIAPYFRGYPPDGSSLGQTKSVIRDNLDGTFDTLNVDHVNNNGQPGSNPAGYHTVIHEVTQTSVSTVTGVNQLFSGVPGTLVVNGTTTPAIPSNGDTQLYSLTGQGVLSQLTGSNASANGYTWIGGILLQWGTCNFKTNGNTVSNNFTIPFPNNVFSLQVTAKPLLPFVNAAFSFSVATAAGPNISSFQINGSASEGGSGSLSGATYMAIGN